MYPTNTLQHVQHNEQDFTIVLDHNAGVAYLVDADTNECVEQLTLDELHAMCVESGDAVDYAHDHTHPEVDCYA